MKVGKRMAALLLCCALLATALGVLRTAPTPQVLLTNATAAPILGGTSRVAVFVDISNTGAADRLIAVSSPVAEDARFSLNDPRRIIPPSTDVSLAMDGLHIELLNVHGDLGDGRTLPVSLTFEKAGTLNTRARLVAPRHEGRAATLGLFGIGDICIVGDGEPAPQITLTAQSLESGWKINVVSQDFEFTPQLVDGPHVPGTGHGHIYLNGVKLGRLYEAKTWLAPLPPGDHEVQVSLSTNDHRAYVVGDTPVVASVRIHAN